MKTKEEILRLFKAKKGQYLSGSDLSQKFLVSRTAVWKEINLLRGEGYLIEAAPRRGYRLIRVPDLLLPAEIRYDLETKILGKEIHHFKEVISTIDIARDLAAQGHPEGTLVVAEVQTAGRGRLERKWFSPPGGIWISLVLRPNILPMDAPKITFLMAVAAAIAIEGQTGIPAKIKWPNDILIKGKKVGGILCEIDAEPDRVIFAILSLGLNANVDSDEFPPEIRTVAASLKQATGEKIDRVRLLRNILENLEKNYSQAKKSNFSSTLSQWKDLCDTLGKKIKISTPYGVFEGLAQDIDEHGALLLKLPSGEVKSFASGDATVLNSRL